MPIFQPSRNSYIAKTMATKFYVHTHLPMEHVYNRLVFTNNKNIKQVSHYKQQKF